MTGEQKKVTPGRFDYTRFDTESVQLQDAFKTVCVGLETMIETAIQCPRSKATALTNLEIVYMWVGKGIRNDQVARTQVNELQEERTNS